MEGLSEGELGVLSWEGTVTLTEVGGGRLPPQRIGCGRAPAPAWIWLPESLLQMQAEWTDSGTQEQRGEDSSGELKPRIGTAPGKILEFLTVRVVHAEPPAIQLCRSSAALVFLAVSACESLLR